LSKNSIFMTVLLTVIWVVLREEISVISAATGAGISLFCVFFCNKYLPLPKTANISFFRLSAYLLFLLKEIYKAGFWAIKIIMKGSRTEVLEVKTSIGHQFSRVALANSITITPGSLSLDVKENTISVLWLAEKEKNKQQIQEAVGHTVELMEKKLSKLQE